MEQGLNSTSETKLNKRSWIIIAIIMICAMLVCAGILVIVGISFLWPLRMNSVVVTESSVATAMMTAVTPSVLGEDSVADNPLRLDYEADPLFGSVSLQRGFSPDPHSVIVVSGGPVNTKDFDLDCGFIWSTPTFAFSLTGGASEGFLRIYYIATDHTNSTLLVHTPDQEVLCKENPSSGNGSDLVIDIEFAPSGRYAIWVGTQESGTYGAGSLFITQSPDNTP